MRKALHKDKDTVIEILSKSFRDNGSIKFVVKNDLHEAKRIKRLMNWSFEYGMDFGEIWLSEDEKSCCIVIHPEKKNESNLKYGLYWNLMFAFKIIGIANIKKVLGRQSSLKKYEPSEAFYHLWYVGVLPEYQGKGLGTSLLQHILSNLKDRPVYLETSNPRNLPLYERLDFKKITTLKLGYDLNIMRKEAETTSA